MTKYRIRVAYESLYPNLVHMHYRKDYRFFPPVEEFACKVYNREVTDIRKVPVKELKAFVIAYLTKKLGDDETILEFDMEIE